MNILTIDLEEWFHLFLSDDLCQSKYESRIGGNVDFILDALQERSISATFFVVGWIARQHPQLVRRISDLGHEIASHSDNHDLVHLLARDEFERDLYRSIETLEDTCGTKVKAYRAPGFSIDRDLPFYIECLSRNGIEIDSSLTSCQTQFGGLRQVLPDQPLLIEANGITLREFPLNTASIFKKRIIYTGGGYFRLLPSWAIRGLFDRSPYNMSYFHPRDFDTVQPRADMSLFADVKRNVGLKGARRKFQQLIASFDFISIQAADKATNWMEAPTLTFSAGATNDELELLGEPQLL